jgi:hypothetical protein
MGELRKLRHESYQAAGEFHQAYGEYFTALRYSAGPQVTFAAQVCRAAGEKYKAALEALYDYLSSALLSENCEEERQRTRTLLETLERELNALLPK